MGNPTIFENQENMPAPTKRARADAPPMSGKRIKLSSTPAYKASTVAAATKKRVELKRLTEELFTGTVTSSGVIIPFPAIPAGDDDDERDGRAVEHRAYQCMMSYIPSNLVDYEKVRVVVVLWKALPSIPTIADVLDLGTWANVFGMYDIKTAKSHEILSDKIYDCNTQGGQANAGFTTFTRNTQLIHIKGVKRYQQTYRSANADFTLADGSALYLVILPLVGGGLSSVVGASTFVDI